MMNVSPFLSSWMTSAAWSDDLNSQSELPWFVRNWSAVRRRRRAATAGGMRGVRVQARAHSPSNFLCPPSLTDKLSPGRQDEVSPSVAAIRNETDRDPPTCSAEPSNAVILFFGIIGPGTELAGLPTSVWPAKCAPGNFAANKPDAHLKKNIVQQSARTRIRFPFFMDRTSVVFFGV